MSAVIIHHLLISALIAVETGSQKDPDHALGDFVRGQPTAFGCLQISQKVIDDVNRISGQAFSVADAFDRPTAVKICLGYLAHYCTPERLGHSPTTQDFARVWNGGPQGWRKAETRAYWRKVRDQLDRYPGHWDADYMNFTPARLRVGRTSKRLRVARPLATLRMEPLPSLISGDRCRPTELPSTNRVSSRGKLSPCASS